MSGQVESRTRDLPHVIDDVRRSLAGLDGRRAAEVAVARLRDRGGPDVYPSVYVARGERLWLVAQSGYQAVFDGVSVHRGVMGRAFRSGETQLILNATGDPDFLEAQGGFVSEITAVAGDVVINIESTQPLGPDVVTPMERLAETLAGRFAAAGDALTPGRLSHELVAMIRHGDVTSILELACRTVARTLEAEAAFALIGSESEEDVIVSWRTPDTDLEPPGVDAIWEVLRNLESVTIWHGPTPSSLWEGEGQTVIVPIVTDGDLRGGIVATHRSGIPTEPAMSSVAVVGEAVEACLDRLGLERRLTQSVAARTEFTRAVSHELRTPLTAIVGYADLILDAEDLGADTVEFVEAIRRNAAHVLEVVIDMLDIARSEAGRLVVRRADEVEVAEVVGQAIGITRPQARDNRVEVVSSIPEDLVVIGDVLRIRQILVNLIANAVKFAPGGRVVVSSDVTDDVVSVSVVDDGEGMTEEEMSGLFLPFTGRSVRDPRSGSGLGLVISRRLAEAMGGSLNLASPGLGLGTTALLELPRNRA